MHVCIVICIVRDKVTIVGEENDSNMAQEKAVEKK